MEGQGTQALARAVRKETRERERGARGGVGEKERDTKGRRERERRRQRQKKTETQAGRQRERERETRILSKVVERAVTHAVDIHEVVIIRHGTSLPRRADLLPFPPLVGLEAC